MLQVLFTANVETRICCFYSVATWSVELENFMPVWPKVYNYVNSGIHVIFISLFFYFVQLRYSDTLFTEQEVRCCLLC